jgi:hypothetical protein
MKYATSCSCDTLCVSFTECKKFNNLLKMKLNFYHFTIVFLLNAFYSSLVIFFYFLYILFVGVQSKEEATTSYKIIEYFFIFLLIIPPIIYSLYKWKKKKKKLNAKNYIIAPLFIWFLLFLFIILT